MIWLFYLGKMLEKNLRPSNYVALILMAGVVTNTAQYLMTGPNFLGYSGILTAYMGFIWMRQKIAPWEGYPLQKSVIQFMGVFIFGMFGISLVSFLTERFFSFSLAPGIANTAHITGIFVGIFLASLPLFKAKTLRL
jgi:GlpG protein